MKRIEYESNNSGGSFWIDDNDFKILETNGWTINWLPSIFLEISATSAYKVFNNIDEAKIEFQSLLNEDPDVKGCDCCGPPHNFYEYDIKDLTYNKKLLVDVVE